MDRINKETFLYVIPQPGESLLIFCKVEELGYDKVYMEIVLKSEEVFGGRTYDEWRSVSMGSGCVSADWLNV